MAHGGKNLYLKLAESGMRPIQDVNRWRSRNQWEIFFVPDKRERLYRQLGFDADGVCYSYVYDDGQLPWANGAVFKNSFTRDEWLLLLAIPLKEVMPQTQRSDRRFYCNILRLMPGAANKMSLSPPFDNDHHSLSNLAEVRLGGVNLLVNPDFSQALTGWRTRAKAVLDRHASPKTDGVSVRIDCKDGYGILLSQGFKATAPAYGVSGWVKTEGFANRWQARIELVAGFRDEEGKAQAKLYTIGATPQHKADSPWTKFERIIEIPAESYSVNCWLSTRHPRNQNEQPNPGTVWFSDLTMVPIGGAQAE